MERKLAWQSLPIVGCEILDHQRQQILMLIREIEAQSALGSEGDSHRQLYLVNEFFVACLNHFKTEEELLAKVQYPDLESHSAEHQKWIERLSILLIETFGDHLDLDRLRKIVRDWWFDHVLVEDMKYQEYFKASNPE